jgi:hypothetical protein
MDDIFDLEKLKQEQEAAQSQKDMYDVVGSAMGGFSKIPSIGDLQRGRKTDRVDYAKQMSDASAAVQDPWEGRK